MITLSGVLNVKTCVNKNCPQTNVNTASNIAAGIKSFMAIILHEFKGDIHHKKP